MTLFGFIVDEIFTLADDLEDEDNESGSWLNLINQKGDFVHPDHTF